jgi:hypothetical protein
MPTGLRARPLRGRRGCAAGGRLDSPIESTGPMKRKRLNILSHVERAELNRHLQDAIDWTQP